MEEGDPHSRNEEQYVRNPETRGRFRLCPWHALGALLERQCTPRLCRGRPGQEPRVVLAPGENDPLRVISEIHVQVGLEYQ